jgi:hypothetical protein
LPYIINLKPGLIDTKRVEKEKNPKMDLKEIDDILKFILYKNIKIHSITFGL